MQSHLDNFNNNGNNGVGEGECRENKKANRTKGWTGKDYNGHTQRHCTFRCWAFKHDLQELSGTARSKVSSAKEKQESVPHKPRLLGQAGVYVGSIFLLLWGGCLHDLSMQPLLFFCILSYLPLTSAHTHSMYNSASPHVEGKPEFESTSCTL